MAKKKTSSTAASPKVKQPKLRSLRMYLLKKTVKTYKDAIRDDIQCQSFPLDTVAGVTGEIFIRPPYPTPVD